MRHSTLSPARIRFRVVFAALLALTACSGPLEKRLLSDNAKTRDRAMLRLKGLSPESRQSLIQPMVEALRSGDGRLANRAEEVLISIGEPSVGPVTAQLDSTDPFLRIISVNILGEIGARPDTTVPILAARLADPHPLVREEAAHALGRFGSQATAALPALRTAAADESPEVADAANEAIALIGKPPAETPSNPS